MNRYKVLLVEDEIPSRTVFRGMIEERHDLFELVGEAEDGQDGLVLYKQHAPQLIVTDITMPGMNGLEMLRMIEAHDDIMPQVVILTCHQDFQFAQQAIQLKAAAYLIKDDCLNDPQLLVHTLEGLAEQIVGRDSTREKQLELEQKVRSNEIVIENNLFLEMLRNAGAEDKWLQSLERVGIVVHGAPVYALMFELDRSSLRFSVEQPQELKLWQFAGVNVLNELLGALGPHKVIALDKGRFVALFTTSAGTVPVQDTFLVQVENTFAKYLKMDGFALLHCFSTGLQEQIRAFKAWAAAVYPFFYDHVSSTYDGASQVPDHFTHIPDQYGRFWGKVLKKALLESRLSPNAVEHERKSFRQQALENRWEPEQIKSLYLRIFLELSRFANESEGMPDLEAAFRKQLEQCQTFDTVHNTTFSFFRKLRLLQEDRKLDASIAKIVQRLHENLSEPFKLEELAASINYSVPYFSTMFKKTTGQSFIQYLNKLRLEKAKLLLLTTDRKTFEIAEEIGFENYRSFNRLFKRDMGLTPSDFRKQGVNNGWM